MDDWEGPFKFCLIFSLGICCQVSHQTNLSSVCVWRWITEKKLAMIVDSGKKGMAVIPCNSKAIPGLETVSPNKTTECLQRDGVLVLHPLDDILQGSFWRFFLLHRNDHRNLWLIKRMFVKEIGSDLVLFLHLHLLCPWLFKVCLTCQAFMLDLYFSNSWHQSE